eukprot:11187070-Lingulodinium_polyedra.AAC.1
MFLVVGVRVWSGEFKGRRAVGPLCVLAAGERAVAEVAQHGPCLSPARFGWGGLPRRRVGLPQACACED